MPGRRFWFLAASLSLTVAAMAAEPAQTVAKLAEVMPNIVADSFAPEEGGKVVAWLLVNAVPFAAAAFGILSVLRIALGGA